MVIIVKLNKTMVKDMKEEDIIRYARHGTKHDVGTMGWFWEMQKILELDSMKKVRIWAEDNRILSDLGKINDTKEHRDNLAIEKGYKNHLDYIKNMRNVWSKNNGYDNHNERQRNYRYDKGLYTPMSENKECSSYFGVYIGEKYVSKLFEDVEKMPYGNPGFDWICKKKYKIDSKVSCLLHRENKTDYFEFTIKYNKKADYFILSAWDNRDSLNPLYVWIFHKNDIIRGKKFWQRDNLFITYKPEYLEEFKKHEVTNKLDKLKELCKR